jgi:protein-disulfide isomerase
VRDFPLEAIHPQAFKAAEAAHCAGEQGKFWDMHHRLFANQRRLGPADLTAHARASALDGARFDECLQSGRHGPRVRKDLADGEKAGVRGTPTFFLALRESAEARLRVISVIRGAQPLATLKEAIDKALRAGN